MNNSQWFAYLPSPAREHFGGGGEKKQHKKCRTPWAFAISH